MYIYIYIPHTNIWKYFHQECARYPFLTKVRNGYLAHISPNICDCSCMNVHVKHEYYVYMYLQNNNMYTCILAFICVCILIYIYLCMPIYVHIRICVYIYIRLCIYIYIHSCIQVYVHTGTYTQHTIYESYN